MGWVRSGGSMSVRQIGHEDGTAAGGRGAGGPSLLPSVLLCSSGVDAISCTYCTDVMDRAAGERSGVDRTWNRLPMLY